MTAAEARFEDVFYYLPKNGWLSKPEAKLLWDVAGDSDGPILEVGCYHGRSTCLLAALGRPVHAVDPFANFDDGDPSGDKIQDAFVENLCSRNLFGNVCLYRQSVESWTPRPCGFAYLDGDHTYDGTLRQVEKALACGARMIAAHDVNDDGGGKDVRDACLKLLGPWQERVERLAWWEVKR